MQNLLTRRHAMKLGLAASLFPSLARAAESPVLIELFTSQGCSDCPPADKLAGELMSQPGLFVVSMNVDYWDYLGWKDTLGKAEYSKRQADYAKARGDGEVYTPQMVINGAAHAVGSNRGAVEGAIATARQRPLVVPVSVAQSGDKIAVDIGAASGSGKVFLMALAPQVSVPIGRGENAGAKITYHNVVRHLALLGDWNGSAKTLTVAKPSGDATQFLAVLQKSEAGEVLGLGAITVS